MTEAEIQEKVAQIVQEGLRQRPPRRRCCAMLLAMILGLLGASGALWAHRAPRGQLQLGANNAAHGRHCGWVARGEKLSKCQD